MTKQILVIDDSPSIRQMVSFTLNRAGYIIAEASNAQDGLAQAGRIQFDLILTDQNMPGMNGLTMVKQLRSTPRYHRTPILILTTESSDAMKDKGRVAGATGWLTKPFEPDKLLTVVAKVLTT